MKDQNFCMKEMFVSFVIDDSKIEEAKEIIHYFWQIKRKIIRLKKEMQRDRRKGAKITS